MILRVRLHRRMVCALAAACSMSGCSSEDGTIDLLPRSDPMPLTCTDGKLDGNETDIDCGGSCEGCGEGNLCEEQADCQEGLECLGTKCKAQ